MRYFGLQFKVFSSISKIKPVSWICFAVHFVKGMGKFQFCSWVKNGKLELLTEEQEKRKSLAAMCVEQHRVSW